MSRREFTAEMKIGLISDIHADLLGLQQALNCLQAQHVDHILCAGDLVEKGDDGDAVVQVVRDQHIPVVRGNHDYNAIENWKYMREHPDRFEIPELVRRDLTAATVDYLENLPKILTFTFAFTLIYVAHGTPWRDIQYVFPSSNRHVFERVASYTGVDVVILGHTHVPMLAIIGDTWIINPGSTCGAVSSGSQTCAVLTLPDRAVTFYDLLTGKPREIESLRFE